MSLSIVYALIGILFFLIVILVAANIFISHQKSDEPTDIPQINVSGVYSIVRRTPRENIGKNKADANEVRQYLKDINEDCNGESVSEDDKKYFVELWENLLEKNIREVENGDREGVEFYYYYFPKDDPVCADLVKKGNFVTREEIFNYPQIIPPFHIGCECVLKAYHGKESLKDDTTTTGMLPLFTEQGNVPKLPDWHTVLKLS